MGEDAHQPNLKEERGMKKLMLAIAVLLLCTACAGVVAAPEPTPTPTKTPKPEAEPELVLVVPEPVATPDPLREELEKRVTVCRLTPYQYTATLPVGDRVSSISFHWIVADSDPTHIHTIRMAEETWVSLEGYETFHFVSVYPLGHNVWVDIEIDGRSITLYPTVKDCPSPMPGPGMSV